MGKYHTLAQAMAAAEARCNRSNACAPERNLSNPMTPLLRGSTEVGKKGSRDEIVGGFTQAVSNDSYKAQKSISASGQSPWAKYQNPTNSPVVANLLDRYGDMRGVILKSPIFQAPCTPVRDGGWGISVGAMINAGKEYTLERVILAIAQTKAYRGANDRGKFFYHVLRKGLETDRC